MPVPSLAGVLSGLEPALIEGPPSSGAVLWAGVRVDNVEECDDVCSVGRVDEVGSTPSSKLGTVTREATPAQRQLPTYV